MRAVHLKFKVLTLLVLSLSGCLNLKNNGEPYPGTAADQQSGPNGGDIIINFPDGSIDKAVACSSTAHNVSVRLGVDNSSSLYLSAYERGSVNGAGYLQTVAEGSAIESHSDTYRSYLSGSIKLYILKDAIGGAYPATLKFRTENDIEWKSLSVQCNSTGYSED